MYRQSALVAGRRPRTGSGRNASARADPIRCAHRAAILVSQCSLISIIATATPAPASRPAPAGKWSPPSPRLTSGRHDAGSGGEHRQHRPAVRFGHRRPTRGVRVIRPEWRIEGSLSERLEVSSVVAARQGPRRLLWQGALDPTHHRPGTRAGRAPLRRLRRGLDWPIESNRSTPARSTSANRTVPR